MPSDSTKALDSVSKFGSLELIKELSSGGAVSVWLARVAGDGATDPRSRLAEVLRINATLVAEKGDVKEGLLREVELAQKLKHPKAVALEEVVSEGSELLLASEVVAGETLASLIAAAGADGLGTDVVLRIGLDALEALSAAHSLAPDALVHGELSPQHIVVGADGVTRVSGFGVARVLAKVDAAGAKGQARLSYAAPERVKAMSAGSGTATAAAPLDPRSDLFSMAVMVWEGIARQRLFTAKMDAAVIQKVLTAPIAPLASVPKVQVPAGVDAALQKALERDPARRYQSAAEFMAALLKAGASATAAHEKVATVVEKLVGASIAARKAELAAVLGAQGDAIVLTGAGGELIVKRGAAGTLLGMPPLSPSQIQSAAQARAKAPAPPATFTSKKPQAAAGQTAERPAAAPSPSPSPAEGSTTLKAQPSTNDIIDEATVDDDWNDAEPPAPAPPPPKPVVAAPAAKPVTVPPAAKPVTLPPAAKPVTVPPAAKPVTVPPPPKPVTVPPPPKPVTIPPAAAAPAAKPITTPPAAPAGRPITTPPAAPAARPITTPPTAGMKSPAGQVAKPATVPSPGGAKPGASVPPPAPGAAAKPEFKVALPASPARPAAAATAAAPQEPEGEPKPAAATGKPAEEPAKVEPTKAVVAAPQPARPAAPAPKPAVPSVPAAAKPSARPNTVPPPVPTAKDDAKKPQVARPDAAAAKPDTTAAKQETTGTKTPAKPAPAAPPPPKPDAKASAPAPQAPQAPERALNPSFISLSDVGEEDTDAKEDVAPGSTSLRGRAATALDKIGPGSTLGRYEILMPVAKGGMASVWAARLQGTRGFQKIVALKTMLPDVSDDPDFESMFLDEARVAARIKHPNVIEIYDLGEQDDVLYIVMEWVEGETLTTLQKAAKNIGGIPLPIMLRLASQICAGLHSAHELRDDNGALLDLVHRDVSPGNVLISASGFAKVADFGIAKSKGRLHVTRASGVVKGKAPYLSPEQLRGIGVDRRSDLFSVGTLLYVMATGLHPFRAETEAKTMENIGLLKPVPLRDVVLGIHPEFEKIVFKALEKDRANRFATAAEMQRAIDHLASSIGQPTTDEDVAAFVRKAIGDMLKERSKGLRAAIAAVDGPMSGSRQSSPSVEPKAPAAGGVAVEAEPKPAQAAPQGGYELIGGDGMDITFDEDTSSEVLKVAGVPPKAEVAPAAVTPAPVETGAKVIPVPENAGPKDVSGPKVVIAAQATAAVPKMTPPPKEDATGRPAEPGSMGLLGWPSAPQTSPLATDMPSSPAAAPVRQRSSPAPPLPPVPEMASVATGAPSEAPLVKASVDENPFAKPKRKMLLPMVGAGLLVVGLAVGGIALSGGKDKSSAGASPERGGTTTTAGTAGTEPGAAQPAGASAAADAPKPAETAVAAAVPSAEPAATADPMAAAKPAASAEPAVAAPPTAPEEPPAAAAQPVAQPQAAVKTPSSPTPFRPTTPVKPVGPKAGPKPQPIKKYNPSGI